MAESHIITGLVKKYAEINGQIDQYLKEINKLKENSQQIEHVIKLFSPEYDLRSIAPRRKYNKDRLFKARECQRYVLDCLLTGDVLTTTEIADQIAELKQADSKDYDRIRASVLASLSYCVKTGKVTKVGVKNKTARWQIVK